MPNNASDWIIAALVALFAALHPWAAAGAAFGCCFFLASPSSTRGRQRVWLSVFSLGLGYAAGVFFYGEGPPFSAKAMLVAAGASALAAVTFTAWYHMIAAGRPLPPWLTGLADLLPFRKQPRQGDSDG